MKMSSSKRSLLSHDYLDDHQEHSATKKARFYYSSNNYRKKECDDDGQPMSDIMNQDENDLFEELSMAKKQLELILSNQFDIKTNPFSFNLIDHINSFLRKETSSSLDYKIIARALQAATKLYISKVLFTKQHSTRLYSKLIMYTGGTDGYDEESSLETDQRNQLLSRIKKKRKRVDGTGCLVTDLSTINGKVETTRLLDPLFHQDWRNFDESNANCLLLSYLKTDPLGVMLCDFGDCLDFSVSTQTNSSLPEVTMKLHFKEFSFKDGSLSSCGNFADFDFLNRNFDYAKDLENMPMEFCLSEDDHQLDLNESIDEHFSQSVKSFGSNFVSRSPLIDIFDQSIEPSSCHVENLLNSSSHVKDNDKFSNGNYHDDHLIHILPEDNNHFFNINFLKCYLKKVSRFYHQNLNNLNCSKEKRHRKQQQSRQENNYKLIDDEFNMFKPTEKQMMRNNNGINLHMENDYGFCPTQLREFFTLKRITFKQLLNQKWLNQTSPAPLKQSANHDFTTNDSNVDHEDYFVMPLDIPYAKKATKVDMRLLKCGMLKAIRRESKHATFSERSLMPASSTLTLSSQSVKVLSFGMFNQQLDHYLSDSSKKDLSLSTKFVSLLHLCNEQSFELGPVAASHQDEYQSDSSADHADFNIFSN